MHPDASTDISDDRTATTVTREPAAPVRIPHAPGLDGLRGLAVAAVVVFHAGPPTWMPGGFLGVSLFFTLSGYLITTLVLAEVQRDESVGLASFWSRRIRRLIPALLALVLGVAVLARFVDLGRGIRVDVTGALTYTTNWIEIVRGQAYGDLFQAPSPLVHLWSLAIEEQFYVILPLVAWVLARRAPDRLRRNLTIGAVGITILGLLATWLTDDPTVAYYGTLHRAPEIAVGALLATCTRPSTVRTPTWFTRVAFGALAITVFAWCNTHVSDSWVTGGGLVPFAVLSAVLVRTAARPGPISTFFSVAPLRRLGLISYGLYLYHWPIVVLLSPPRVDWAPVPLFLVRAGISLALAVVSYFFLEQRFRRGWPATPAGTVIILGIVALVITLVFALVIAPAGETATVRRKPAPAVVDPKTAATQTTTAEAPGPARLAIVGDSVPSWIIRDGGSGLDPEKVALIDGTLESCDGARGNPVARSRTGALVPTPEGCTGWPSQYPQFFERADDVAVLMIGGHAALDRQIEGQFRSPCDPVAAGWYRNDVQERLLFLDQYAEHVVVILPSWAEDRAEWIYPSDHIARMDCVRQVLTSAADAEDAAVIDFGSYVCPGGPGQCRSLRTKDGMHLDADKAPAALSWLVVQVLDVTGTKPPPTTTSSTAPPAPVTSTEVPKAAVGDAAPTSGN
ncbi:acyltransferase family protein [Aquihabitans daechungensis]|uniref:acyltransferase family protein n=1 Tax=Aquihabitans daechungensis TaxID=1052257 RepID=UPI003B9FED64